MIVQAVIEYLANAFWQVPLLVAGAWLLLRMVRTGPAAQHRVWLAVLGLALMLPLHGISYGTGTGVGQGMLRVDSVSAQPVGAGMQAFDAVGEPGGLLLGRKAGAGTSLPTSLSASLSWITSSMTLPARVRRVQLSAVAAQWIVGLYLAVALFGLFRIMWAWRTARRLVKDSREIALPDRADAAVLDCARRFGVKPPQVRESSEIRGPVVVGAVAPVLLWPENFANYPEDEVVAALCHEMAHIKRGDYLMNLLCETAALPLRWHPAVYGVGRRIRGTREMVCDAMAAEAMQSETAYAKCLLRLAQSMVGDGLMEQAAGSAAAGLFSSNVLEERVMRLIQGKVAMSMRAKAARGVAGAVAMTAAIALAAMFHVVPAMAQSQTEAQPTTTGSGVQGGVQGGVPGGVSGGVVTGPTDAPPVLAPAPPPGPVPAPGLAPASAPLVLPAVPPAPVAAVQSVPSTPAAPVAPVAPPAPASTVAPVAPAPEKDLHHHEAIVSKDGKAYAWVDGQKRELTPAERARLEAQLDEAQKKIAAEMERLNSPEFREQMEKAQRDAEEAARSVNSAEFQEQMAKAQKQVADATARINSPEFKKQIEDAAKAASAIDSAAMQKQMADAQRQVAEATARINSPEFKKQIEDAAKAASAIDSAAIQKQMADAQKQLAEELEKLKAEQDKQDKNEPK